VCVWRAGVGCGEGRVIAMRLRWMRNDRYGDRCCTSSIQ
jgi:hypothetical protein